jgi:hypothetical protein
MNKIYPIDLFLQDPAITEFLIDGYQHVYMKKTGNLKNARHHSKVILSKLR